MKIEIKVILSSKYLWIFLYVLAAIASSLQLILRGDKTFEGSSIIYTHYNNYIIFKNSFYHLQNFQDLYILYLNEQWDLYKYTPTFSVFFSLFTILPDWLGLAIWNIINALVLLFSVYYLPKLDNNKKGLILVLLLVEMITSLQSAQSNALMAGLLIFSFGLLERNKYFWAIFCIMFSFYIKIFGILGLVFCLFYPEKLKLSAYTLFWAIALFCVPFVFIDLPQYLKLLESYGVMLTSDHGNSYGFSVLGWIHSWFNIEVNKNGLVLLGAFIFMAPFIFISKYKDLGFKYLALASLLIWVVIFNHKAESPTFIISIAGVVIWYIISEKNKISTSLFLLAFMLTSLSPTDIFPKFIREEYINQYSLKALPCILIWFKIIYEMTFEKKQIQ